MRKKAPEEHENNEEGRKPRVGLRRSPTFKGWSEEKDCKGKVKR